MATGTIEFTDNGIDIPNFAEIRAKILNTFRNQFGNIIDSNDNWLAQYIDIVAERDASIIEAIGAMYNSRDADNATGFNSDNIAGLLGLRRLQESPTTVLELTVVGTSGANIPGNRVVQVDQGQQNAGSQLLIEAGLTFPASGSTTVIATANVAGPLKFDANSITTIVTPVTGWTSCNNLDDAIPGRNLESDFELNARRKGSVAIAGAGTADSIVANILQNVDGVTYAKLFTNPSPTPTVEGIPPWNDELVVIGGDAQEIVDEYWRDRKSVG